MLLKKVEDNGVIKATYSSSNICASTYNKATRALEIIFTNGGKYKYNDVTLTDYTRFELADSQGAVVNSHIKKYVTENLGKVDTTQIIAEITQLKEADRKQELENASIVMIHKLKALITYHEHQDKIDVDLFNKALESMNGYKTKLEAK